MKLICLSLILAVASIQASAQQVHPANQREKPPLPTKSFEPNAITGKLIPVHKGDSIFVCPDVEFAPRHHYFLKGAIKAIVGGIAAYQVNKSLSGPVTEKAPHSRSNEILPTLGVGIGLAVPDVIKGIRQTRKPSLVYSFYDKDMLLTKSYSKKVSRKGAHTFGSIAPADGFLKVNLVGNYKNDISVNRLAVDSKENLATSYEGNVAAALGADYTGGCTTDYDFDDDWWDDYTEEGFSDVLDDGGFYDEYADISDDFESFMSNTDGWGDPPADHPWTFLDAVTVYAQANPDDGINWNWLDAVTVTASTNPDHSVDDIDWSWLMNQMLYQDDPYITGYDPTYTYPQPVADPPPAEYKPKPKYAKANMKLKIKMQTSPMTCVPATMSYLNEAVCGGNHSESYYISQYETAHAGANVSVDGIPLSEMTGYVNAQFTTSAYNGAITSLDAGNPILTTIKNSNGYHSVVIIGYDESSDPNNRRLYYVDPDTGGQSSMLYNDWNTGDVALYAYPITGCK
ncbi:hypothetical protein A4H97_04660 [Niastella yeongjuensis]|uniref:Peptidase C39-like domain-containing protein n=1 Tax=Niastella yeongjuensis TaxID=354355 RepID=A0A1V9EL03_9BACT|nr:C39 family peptidase [Niastella yeongjuensis]OQP46819.1 hypothetical protein A4H97_04660 [Niastella yeongjuensis]SEN55648.1 Peptidase_C39 like family protein [Niastella yeongjuensis]